MKYWIQAFRLRTLPLALSSIIMGATIALYDDSFRLNVFVLSIVTTIFLQILSNLANDYGDSQNGADNIERKGPSRAVQSGEISSKAMYKAIIIFVFLSLIAGLGLLYTAFSIDEMKYVLMFFILGIASIIAAIKYTAGDNPYGYAGLGDISVFVFFGLLGVVGSAYLHSKVFDWMMLLPGVTIGALSTGVLNVNNLRDIDSDKVAGKYSIPVRIGERKAKIYHVLLLAFGLDTLWIYAFFNNWSYYFLLGFPFIFYHIYISWVTDRENYDPLLKQLALSTFLLSLLCLVGGII